MTIETHSGHRASRAQRMANTMLGRAIRNGRGPSFLRLLRVRGRRSGATRETPVAPVREGGRTWVVSPYGDVGWVRNARVAGELELVRGDERTTFSVRELGADESKPVLDRYLSTPARYFAGRPTRDATRPHPVFELTPIR